MSDFLNNYFNGEYYIGSIIPTDDNKHLIMLGTRSIDFDYYKHEIYIQDLNELAYFLIKNFRKNKESVYGNLRLDLRKYKSYTNYIRTHWLWKQGKALQIYNNKDLNGEKLICWFCNKEIVKTKHITLHHREYNIKQYFGSLGSEEICCIVHNSCHKKIHGWR